MKIAIKLSDKKKSAIISEALKDNLPNTEIADDAEIIIDEKFLPAGKFKLGELLDKIGSHNAKIKIAGLSLEANHKLLTSGKKQADLTEMEVDIIKYLNGKTATKEEFLEHVWKYSADAATRTVETHIHRLNQKTIDVFGFKLIATQDGTYSLIKN